MATLGPLLTRIEKTNRLIYKLRGPTNEEIRIKVTGREVNIHTV